MSSHLCFSLLLNIQRQIELQNEKRGLRDSPVNCQAELPNFPTRQKVKGSSTKRLQELSKASTHSLRLDLDGVWKRSKKQPSGINPELHGPMSYVSPASLRQKQNHESPASSGPFQLKTKIGETSCRSEAHPFMTLVWCGCFFLETLVVSYWMFQMWLFAKPLEAKCSDNVRLIPECLLHEHVIAPSGRTSSAANKS